MCWKILRSPVKASWSLFSNHSNDSTCIVKSSWKRLMWFQLASAEITRLKESWKAPSAEHAFFQYNAASMSVNWLIGLYDYIQLICKANIQPKLATLGRQPMPNVFLWTKPKKQSSSTAVTSFVSSSAVPMPSTCCITTALASFVVKMSSQWI